MFILENNIEVPQYIKNRTTTTNLKNIQATPTAQFQKNK